MTGDASALRVLVLLTNCCHGFAPPGVMGAPSGVMGAPPDEMGAPPNMIGAPPAPSTAAAAQDIAPKGGGAAG